MHLWKNSNRYFVKRSISPLLLRAMCGFDFLINLSGSVQSNARQILLPRGRPFKTCFRIHACICIENPSSHFFPANLSCRRIHEIKGLHSIRYSRAYGGELPAQEAGGAYAPLPPLDVATQDLSEHHASKPWPDLRFIVRLVINTLLISTTRHRQSIFRSTRLARTAASRHDPDSASTSPRAPCPTLRLPIKGISKRV